MLRAAVSSAGSTAEIAATIRYLRTNFREPFSAEQVASKVNLSVPSFNRRFRAVTGTSPLQHHKQLRMQEARRLLSLDGQDAAATAF